MAEKINNFITNQINKYSGIVAVVGFVMAGYIMNVETDQASAERAANRKAIEAIQQFLENERDEEKKELEEKIARLEAINQQQIQTREDIHQSLIELKEAINATN